LENINDIRVSVVVPTFNRAHYLPEALQSALEQTLPVFEIIVVDDGSTDGTAGLMKSYGDKIRYLVQKNQGPSAARNHALREARGNWIAFLDSDDLWVPEKNLVQTEFIRRHPALDFVFGDLANFDERRCDQTPEILDRAVHQYLQANAADLKDFFRQLLFCNPVPTSSALFRADCIRRIGFLDETMRYCEDYDYWLRLAPQARAGFVDHILVRRRVHETNAIKAYVAICEGTLKTLKRWRQKEGLSADVRRIILRRIASVQYNLSSHLLKCGRFGEAYLGLAELQAGDFQGSILWRTKIRIKMLLARAMGGKIDLSA